MHSSMMRTARRLTVSGGGAGLPNGGLPTEMDCGKATPRGQNDTRL